MTSWNHLWMNGVTVRGVWRCVICAALFVVLTQHHPITQQVSKAHFLFLFPPDDHCSLSKDWNTANLLCLFPQQPHDAPVCTAVFLPSLALVFVSPDDQQVPLEAPRVSQTSWCSRHWLESPAAKWLLTPSGVSGWRCLETSRPAD